MTTSQKHKIIYLVFLVAVILLNTVPLKLLFMEIGWRWLYILICSTTLSFAFTPVMRYIALRFDVCDIPNARKVHSKSTPLLGGVAIYIAVVSSILTNYISAAGLLPILTGATIIVVIGIIDDIKEISAKVKLIGQLAACFIVIYSGIVLELFPINTMPGNILNIIITLLWIIGITNALNFFDGMDGLASGLSCIIAFFLGIVAFRTGQVTLGWLSIAIVGACIGFLPFNFRPKENASIFLGDAGSTFLGFLLSSLAVLGEWSNNDPIVSFSVPILIFFVLIFDMTYITIFRIKSGKVTTFKEWIDYVGKDHLHHRLEALFHSKRLSVIFIYFLTICLSITAILLKNAERIDAYILILQAVILVIIISILERVGQKKERRKD